MDVSMRAQLPQVLVNQKNYTLGCRICRKTLLATSTLATCVRLEEIMSEFLEGEQVSYSDALELCTGVVGSAAEDMPKRLW